MTFVCYFVATICACNASAHNSFHTLAAAVTRAITAVLGTGFLITLLGRVVNKKGVVLFAVHI